MSSIIPEQTEPDLMQTIDDCSLSRIATEDILLSEDEVDRAQAYEETDEMGDSSATDCDLDVSMEFTGTRGVYGTIQKQTTTQRSIKKGGYLVNAAPTRGSVDLFNKVVQVTQPVKEGIIQSRN